MTSSLLFEATYFFPERRWSAEGARYWGRNGAMGLPLKRLKDGKSWTAIVFALWNDFPKFSR